MTLTDEQRGPETELVITRRLAAPRDLVWRVWTDADHLAAWCKPNGFTTRVDAHEFRVGGYWRYVMIGPDGVEYPSEGMFVEIDPPNRLVSTDQFSEDYVAPAGDSLPTGILVTLVFEDAGEDTEVTVRISHPTVEERKNREAMGVVVGWNSTIDELDAYLALLRLGA